MSQYYTVFNVTALILIGFFFYGSQILVGVASTDFASKKAIGTANRLADTIVYVGSGLSGICVGNFINNYGWIGPFGFFIGVALRDEFFFILILRRVNKKKNISI